MRLFLAGSLFTLSYDETFLQDAEIRFAPRSQYWPMRLISTRGGRRLAGSSTDGKKADTREAMLPHFAFHFLPTVAKADDAGYEGCQQIAGLAGLLPPPRHATLCATMPAGKRPHIADGYCADDEMRGMEVFIFGGRWRRLLFLAFA